MSFIRRIKKGNAVYLAEVESVRQGKTVKQKFIRYIGKEVNGKQILSSSISNLTIDSIKVYGPLALLNSLASSIELHSHLGEYAKELLSMVYAHCINPQSISSLTDWFKKTDLNFILDLDGVTEERLLKAIDSLEQLNWDILQHSIFESVKENYNITATGIFYDVTNTYLYGRRCTLGKLGHSKHGKNNNPLIQIGLGILRHSGIPVFHSVYEGNIHDARIFSDAIERFSSFDIRDVIVVYDRGITSESNVSALKRLNLQGICGVPIRGSIKQIVRMVVKKNKILDYKNRIKLTSTKIYADDKAHSMGGINGKLIVCYNPRMREDIRENRYDEIQHAQENIRLKKNIKHGLAKYFDEKGQLKKSVLNAAEEMDGYSCIFSTNKRLSKEEIIKTYYEKDLVEKAFRTLHGVVKLRPIRHWLNTRVVGHVFICYLSYLLLSLFQYRLAMSYLHYSATDALKKLDTYYKVYARDADKGFTFQKTVSLTKEQEAIVKAVDRRIAKM
ncbi:MAG: transposase [Deltaproteobacteria bacterium]|nr:transposase [Deltaproteobacteria bacterium]